MKELKYIQIANKLNQELHDALVEHKLHFRGNIKSLSLVSLSKATPELGISNIKTEKTALKLFHETKHKKAPFSLGRTTREKELQAWLIYNALSNNRKIYFDDQLEFVTSELALYENGNRIVNDILAVDRSGDLVVIELKSARDKHRIESQVLNFIRIINTNKVFFSELLKTTLNKNWSGKVKGIVVWNNSSKPKRVINSSFREICYLEKLINGKRYIDYDAKGNVQFKELF